MYVRVSVVACMSIALSGSIRGADSMPLLDVSVQLDLASFTSRAVTLTQHLGAGGVLRVDSTPTHDWPGFDVKPAAGSWDLSRFGEVVVEVRNAGASAGRFCCRVDNPGADGVNNCLTGRIDLAAGEGGTIRVPLPPAPSRGAPVEFIGMRGTPFSTSARFDSSNVVGLVLFVPRPKENHVFEIARVCASGESQRFAEGDVPDPFFPMIDEFGQYMHKDWPGKIGSVDDLRQRAVAEQQDLDAHPGPGEWNQYGGWSAGPQLDATGAFRVHKLDGKWWLVDPEGRLFWSNGIDGVRAHNSTPITDREHYYAWLPDDESPFAAFYGWGNWAPRGYYHGRGRYRHYDFTRANLLRKYGESWEERFAEVSHRRLRSWGVNTMANWSAESITLRKGTPYVVAVHYASPDLRASTGLWKKFSDVFDPGFREGLAKRLQNEIGRSAGDPWCIGYFVDNELDWGNETSLALATLRCPADQAAKQVFVEDLRTSYGAIDALNEAWGTEYASWEALLTATDTVPDEKRAGTDLRAFYSRTAETYFRTVREEVKRIAPNQLYLGCRFSNSNDLAVRAAAGSCDVISFNRYTYSVANDRLPDGVDMPMIIGEFHFGALDRGMFHTGLRKARNQEHRAQLYAEYLRGALAHPQYVGAHWFIYKDQATTGRGDGENYQIGFVDNCDTPNPEIIAAAREIGSAMYRLRAGNR